MICNHPLTAQQKKKNIFNYNCFNAINGISYMCLGETVLLLLAVKINASDPIVSALGAMMYLGYFLLPLGKVVSAKYGGAYSQNIFWILRNISVLVVAASALVSKLGYHITAMTMLLVGAFFFYGFRAAGVVMCQPLIGDFTDETNRSKVLAVSNGIFFFTRMTTLITITLITRINDSLTTLVSIIVFGAVCGITSSKFLRNIDETESICKSAEKSITPEISWAIKFKPLRRLLTAGFFCNLSWIMTIPVTTLAVKRGYHSNDSDVLLFTVIFSAGSCLASFISNHVSKVLGPKRQMMLPQLLFIATSFAWMLLPLEIPFAFMLLQFFLLGMANIWALNSSTEYFLNAVPPEHRVGAAILHAVITGVISGLSGIFITGFMLKTVPLFCQTALEGYKLYFTLTGFMLIPGLFIIKRLPSLDADRKKINLKYIFNRGKFFIFKQH